MNINDLDKIKVPKKEIEEIKRNVYNLEEDPRQSRSKFKYAFATLVLIFSLGFAFPSYTMELPLYKNVFELLNMNNYENASTALNMAAEDKGVEIRLTNIVYSNDKISYAFILKSDEYLGEYISFDEDIKFKNAKTYGRGGGLGGIYKGNKTYICSSDMNYDFKGKAPDKLDMTIKITNLDFYENDQYRDKKSIKGNWKFNVSADKLSGENYLNPASVEENSGLYAKIEQITINDLGTEFKINFWNNLGIESHAFQDYPPILLDGDKSVELKGGSGTGNLEVETRSYLYDKKLEKNKDYKLILNFKKSNGEYFNIDSPKANLEEFTKSENYKNAPEKITIAIPFNLQ